MNHPLGKKKIVVFMNKKLKYTIGLLVLFYFALNLLLSFLYTEFSKGSASYSYFFGSSSRELAIQSGIFVKDIDLKNHVIKSEEVLVTIHEAWLERAANFDGKFFLLPFSWEKRKLRNDFVLVIYYSLNENVKIRFLNGGQNFPFFFDQNNVFRARVHRDQLELGLVVSSESNDNIISI